jgi:hypothetical protein
MKKYLAQILFRIIIYPQPLESNELSIPTPTKHIRVSAETSWVGRLNPHALDE